MTKDKTSKFAIEKFPLELSRNKKSQRKILWLLLQTDLL